MDLCRKILIEVESWPTTTAPDIVVIEGYSAGAVGYNAWLLADQELIEGMDMTGAGDAVDIFAPRCLTAKGHDFLEHARDDTIWQKAKAKLASLGGPMTTQTLLMILKQLIAKQIGS